MAKGPKNCYCCERRVWGCHSGCDIYKEFRQQLDAKAAAAHSEREYYDYFAKAVSRMSGKKIKGGV